MYFPPPESPLKSSLDFQKPPTGDKSMKELTDHMAILVQYAKEQHEKTPPITEPKSEVEVSVEEIPTISTVKEGLDNDDPIIETHVEEIDIEDIVLEKLEFIPQVFAKEITNVEDSMNSTFTTYIDSEDDHVEFIMPPWFFEERTPHVADFIPNVPTPLEFCLGMVKDANHMWFPPHHYKIRGRIFSSWGELMQIYHQNGFVFLGVSLWLGYMHVGPLVQGFF
ncbi:uncharacterized protein LOC122067354 [Macadamia integrifolia]|uniref:uncharacterized protein LOC122067354 n=1 Tax=Macadamia integrifolia TaxID=60698 RepID=UPI001C4F2739|nr:uncharacterized protein LOC122067354 [Macadamia integrifolia]